MTTYLILVLIPHFHVIPSVMSIQSSCILATNVVVPPCLKEKKNKGGTKNFIWIPKDALYDVVLRIQVT